MPTATKTAPAKAAPRKTAAAKGAAQPPAEIDLAGYAVQMIALADIDTSVNPRTSMDDDATVELAGSITEHGLQTPIRVEETGGQPAYRLVFGGRRIAAFRLLGREFIPATVRPAGEPARTAAARLVENLQRADLSPLDEARALQELVTEHGMKQVDVAQLIGRNQGYVSKRLALLKLLPKGQAMVTNGILSLEHAVDVAKLPEVVQSSVLTKVQGGTSPEVAVRDARARLDDLKERTALIKKLEKGGTPVIDRASDNGPLPTDARRVYTIDDEEWLADPGRLAVVQRSCTSWQKGLARWVDRYTTTPESAEDADRGEELARTPVPGQGEQLAGFTGSPDAGAGEARAAAEARRDAAAHEQQAREARLAELRDFVRTLINGKISRDWEPFLVRLSLITALVGDPDDAEGCPAAVSSAGEALALPVHDELDLQGYETLTAVLGLLESNDAPGTLLRLTLGARLFNALRFLDRFEAQLLVAAEVLAFLQSQGLELTESEAATAAARTNLLDGLAVMWEMVEGRPDDEEPPVIDAELPAEDAAAEEEVDEATGEPDDEFDAPVETFRPDRAAEATRPTAAEIEAMKRPQLVELAAKHNVETTPRMTRLQLVGACKKALVDPATDIA